MPRFFSDTITNSGCIITGDDARHISKVLRMRAGEEVTVCDMRGSDYLCKISNITKTEVCLDVISQSPSVAESDIKISIFIAFSNDFYILTRLIKTVNTFFKNS